MSSWLHSSRLEVRRYLEALHDEFQCSFASQLHNKFSQPLRSQNVYGCSSTYLMFMVACVRRSPTDETILRINACNVFSNSNNGVELQIAELGVRIYNICARCVRLVSTYWLVCLRGLDWRGLRSCGGRGGSCGRTCWDNRRQCG